MIRLNLDVKSELESAKLIPRESLNDCTKRILDENKAFKNEYHTTQIHIKMLNDLINFILNPDVPDSKNNHREIWRLSHPGETLTPDDLIHHINGNHDDNRPENLQKVSAKEHGIAHAEINKKEKEEKRGSVQSSVSGSDLNGSNVQKPQ